MYPHIMQLIGDLLPREKAYKHWVDGSLFIFVTPNGSKLWRYKYRYAGKQNTYAMGKYPDCTVEQAFAERDRIKFLLKEGRDPNFEKRLSKQEHVSEFNRLKARGNQLSFSYANNGHLVIEAKSQIVLLSPPQIRALIQFISSLDPVEAALPC